MVIDYYNLPGQKIPPKAFFTDNLMIDQEFLTKTFATIFPEMDNIDVIQDVWHLEQRIVKTLPRAHSDWLIATKELKVWSFNLIIDDFWSNLSRRNFG